MNENFVNIFKVQKYNENEILSALPPDLFNILPGETVVLKPNWVCESHLDKPGEWEQIITHPYIIKAVLQRVIEKLQGMGKIIITDGPQTDSSFRNILALNDVNAWYKMARDNGIDLEIIDLRDEEWISKKGVIIKRRKIKGDPRGKTEVNLRGEESEFFQHVKSQRGYYGADINIKQTNDAHDGLNNLYSVSRSVLEADVFINLPKLKTHKKAGITCSLKNLVGINTNKNYLPHHSEGSPAERGDQYPQRNFNAKIEGPIAFFIKGHVLKNTLLARLFAVVRPPIDWIFGKTDDTIRSGNWYGNDTLWRMVLDLNKVLFYGKPDGTLRYGRYDDRKKYISIVDGIVAGEGNGPLKAERIEAGMIIVGYNPVSVDYVSALLMGFDPDKIPTIWNSFLIRRYKIADFQSNEIMVKYNGRLIATDQLSDELIHSFKPHFGWKGHIEKEVN